MTYEERMLKRSKKDRFSPKANLWGCFKATPRERVILEIIKHIPRKHWDKFSNQLHDSIVVIDDVVKRKNISI